MSTAALNLPVSIPWKLIAVSPDMMDKEYCGRGTPYHWRSSIAISAFEPTPEDLPEGLCDALTYLKVSCTITGYQPSPEEIEEVLSQEGRAGYIRPFPDVPTIELEGLLEREYFGCYGAQISVAVYPPQTPPDYDPSRALKDYPHIIDFEPKQRDFYQAATETGEILTTSNNALQTDKSLTHATGLESGVEFGMELKIPIAEGIVGGLSGKTSRKRTETDQDNWTVHTDASRQWRETQGATTQITQMYNLLQSYHVGTNRALFLMLPRPNSLQPTTRRTFVQGLRIIEGIQEFFLVVQRPKDMHGLCVEVMLETGHFPEEVEELPVEYYEDKQEFALTIRSTQGEGDETKDIPTTLFTILPGEHDMVVDDRPSRTPDPGHPGLQQGVFDLVPHLVSTSTSYDYRMTNETTLKIEGQITFKAMNINVAGHDISYREGAAVFNRTYTVLTRSRQPKPLFGGVKTRLLITRRQLCACLAQRDNCMELVPTPDGHLHPSDASHLIVDEPLIVLNTIATVSSDGSVRYMPATKETLTKLHHAMASSARSLRRASAPVGFLDSDYFKDRVRSHIPPERLSVRLSDVKGIPANVAEALGPDMTLGAVLDLGLGAFARATGLKPGDAAKARRVMLGEVRPGQGSKPPEQSR